MAATMSTDASTAIRSNERTSPIVCIYLSYACTDDPVNIYPSVRGSNGKRPDLAAMLAPLTREAIAAEGPATGNQLGHRGDAVTDIVNRLVGGYPSPPAWLVGTSTLTVC
jgi:hypothetical protein